LVDSSAFLEEEDEHDEEAVVLEAAGVSSGAKSPAGAAVTAMAAAGTGVAQTLRDFEEGDVDKRRAAGAGAAVVAVGAGLVPLLKNEFTLEVVATLDTLLLASAGRVPAVAAVSSPTEGAGRFTPLSSAVAAAREGDEGEISAAEVADVSAVDTSSATEAA
jgi:hypothetical protein